MYYLFALIALAVYWELELNWDSDATREFRAKNPLGVSTSQWTENEGAIGEDNSKNDHLAVMPSMRSGADAAAALLKNNYFGGGYTTPYDIGNRWSGDSPVAAQRRGDTKTYGDNLAEVMGYDPVGELNFLADGNALMRALAIMENGNPAREIPAGYWTPSLLKASVL